jgi:chemotaxis protein methyltransferase CheR
MTIAAQNDTTRPTSTRGALSPGDYRFLQDYVRRLSGIALGEDKLYLLESRLLPLASARGLDGLGMLCGVLRDDRDILLKQEVIEAMTTNETFFFRDAPQYDALRRVVIPACMEEPARLPELRFWSAATSSGQEVYSLAMMLLEMDLKGWSIRILATDLSEQMLTRARRGRFTQVEMSRGLPATYAAKYFSKIQTEWQLKDEVLRMVQFDQHDLRQELGSAAPFDIIFCRNVLIYFDVETKTRILSDLRGRLRPGGYLLLGNSETTLQLDATFARRVYGEAVLYQAP